MELQPNQLEVLTDRATAFLKFKRTDEALTDIKTVLRLQPDDVRALNLAGTIFSNMKLWDEAMVVFQEVLRRVPDDQTALTGADYVASHACRWEAHESRLQALEASIKARTMAADPFVVFSKVDDPALLKMAAENLQARSAIPTMIPAPAWPRRKRERIHVAYVCAEFKLHATTILMAQVPELHDRQCFEITAISVGPASDCAMRDRIRAAVDRFIDAHTLSDEEIVQRCRTLGVDMAIDLNGISSASRPGIWAGRCAPLRVNWLAYPGTTGAEWMDYIVADRTLIAEEDLAHYSEKVIWLPHTYQSNDRKREIAATRPSRPECGLPENGFVFCCFNNNYKIRPETFDVWMRILHRTPASVLWLLEDSAGAAANLRTEAAARGVDPTRLVFTKRMPPPQHLARHALADLFLDSWPYNAHTTASDALWGGLPVLTLRGRSFQARVAASLLNAIGLPDLITQSEAEYEDLAAGLALDPGRLAALKAKLQAHRLVYPLFDCARFTRNLESAYRQIVERHDAGQAPDHLRIRDPQAAWAA